MCVYVYIYICVFVCLCVCVYNIEADNPRYLHTHHIGYENTHTSGHISHKDCLSDHMETYVYQVHPILGLLHNNTHTTEKKHCSCMIAM